MPSKKSKSSSKDLKKKKSSKSKVSSKSSKSSKSSSKVEEKVGEITNVGEDGSPEFEAGVVFQRYDQDNSGVLNPSEFQKMWSDQNIKKANDPSPPHPTPLSPHPTQVGRGAFEFGKWFSKFDESKDGRLSKKEFEQLFQEYTQASTLIPRQDEENKKKRHQGGSGEEDDLGEIVYGVDRLTGEMITHYNESRGIPLSMSSLHYHKGDLFYCSLFRRISTIRLG